MARIKNTKNELKAQREALTRYRRFLPMLQLKKQQLQTEIQRIAALVAEMAAEEARLDADLRRWVALLAEPIPLESLVTLARVTLDTGNIAGVPIPVVRSIAIHRPAADLFATPPWVDDAQDRLAALIQLRVERETLEEQQRRVEGELRVTSQRVNLFEKVKIPEAQENIRIIRIFLGDQQTAAVVRGKLAKGRVAGHELRTAAAPGADPAAAGKVEP